MRKNKSITIRIDENLSNKLNKVSHRDKISVGELCRNLLDGGLKNEQKNNKQSKRQKNLQEDSSINKEN